MLVRITALVAVSLVCGMQCSGDSLKAAAKGKKVVEQVVPGETVVFDGATLTFKIPQANRAGAATRNRGLLVGQAPSFKETRWSANDWELEIDLGSGPAQGLPERPLASKDEEGEGRDLLQLAAEPGKWAGRPLAERDLIKCRSRGEDWIQTSSDSEAEHLMGRVVRIAGGFVTFGKGTQGEPQKYRIGSEVFAVGIGLCK